jgi:hypothetical protein
MQVILGRDQTASIDGVELVGTKDFQVDIEGITTDVTPPGHAWTSTLVVGADVTITINILWADNYEKFRAKFNQHPPQPMLLTISNVCAELPVIMTGVPIAIPIAGLMSWQVKLKPWFLGE